MALKVLPLFFFFFFFFFFFLLLIQSLSIHATRDVSAKPSGFGFIKELQGSHKGSHAKGIHDLKKVLKHLGYLQYTIKTHATDDYFDATLASAIKTYQHNFNLKRTGELDAETVSTMIKPRCAVPDIVNGTNVMQHGNTVPSSDALRTVSHYSFFPGRPVWRASKRRLTYRYFTNTPTWAVAPMDKAYQSWAAVSPFTFVKVPSNSASDLTVGWYRGAHGDWDFDGRGGYLAHAYAPEDGRLHMDLDDDWSSGALRGYYDITTCAAHEIGHNLGLDHSTIGNALMYPTIPIAATKGIHQDDIQGLKVLYRF